VKITIEVTNENELNKLLAALHTLPLENLEMNISGSANTLPITKGDKTVDPSALFGVWKDAPRNLAQIRKEGWDRK
jgi:hypothetical protein